jgi:hypothetical protein
MLEQEKSILYENKLVTFVDWASRNVKTGTINIKVLNRNTFVTVEYNQLKNA